MILRDYQQACVEAIIDQWRTHQSTLLVLPTGMGKTIVFAYLIGTRQPGRTLVLAHRMELIYQACDKIHRVTGLACEIEMADQIAATNLFHRTPVVVSTIQTQVSGNGVKRMTRFNPMDYSTLIIDEAHRATADTYRKVLAYYKQNPNLKILGVTATPNRTDQEALGQIFESVAANYGIRDGVDGGWLVEITQQFVPVAGLDYSHVRTNYKTGDFNEVDLQRVLELESNIAGMCQPTLEIVHGLDPHSLDKDKVPMPEWGDYLRQVQRERTKEVLPRKFVIFAASVIQAEQHCNLYNRVLPGLCAWICGKTPKDERRNILEQFAKGQIRGLVNVACLTEGWDDPTVEVLIMAKPTKSQLVYQQCIGRSLRPLPGTVDGLTASEQRIAAIAASTKPIARIIDFKGNSGNHKCVTSFDCLGGKVSPQAVQNLIARAAKGERVFRVNAELTKEESRLIEERKRKAEQARLQEEARKANMVPHSKFSVINRDPYNHNDSTNAKPMPRRQSGRPFSEKQAKFLRRFCGKDPSQIPYGYGVKLIAEKIKEWEKRKAA